MGNSSLGHCCADWAFEGNSPFMACIGREKERIGMRARQCARTQITHYLK